MLAERRPSSWSMLSSDPARAEAVVARSSRSPVRSLRSRCSGRVVGEATCRSAASAPPPRPRLARGSSAALGTSSRAWPIACEIASIDSDAGDVRRRRRRPAPYMRLRRAAGPTARRAGCRRARRSARPASAAPRRTRSPLQVALAQPAERAPLVVDEQRDVEVGVLERACAPRRRARRPGTVATVHRSMSRTRCSARRLSARSAPTKSSTNVVGRVRSSSAGGAYWASLPPSLQDRDPVAHLDRLVDVVGDEDDRLAQLGLQAQELVLQALAVDRVDRAERLVHEHHRRVDGERAGDADALALAAGELRRVAVAHLVRVEPDELEQLVDARGDALLVPAEQARARSRCSRRPCGAGTGRSAGST